MAEPAGASFLECVHDDVFEIITRNVSVNSYRDLLSMRSASKNLIHGRLRNYSGFLKHANIESLLALPQMSRKQIEFVRDCVAFGNSEASFWLGLYDLFRHDDWVRSSNVLKAAADNGHVLSMYAWGMFAIVHGQRDDEVVSVLLVSKSFETMKSLRERLHHRFFTTPTFSCIISKRHTDTTKWRRRKV